MEIKVYHSRDKSEWDDFVAQSRQGTFLFYRDYMDYHQDRFVDHSLLVRDGKGRLIALLPATETEDIVESHGGLTYGGFVTDVRMSASIMLEVFEETLVFLRDHGFGKLIYKPVPHIYHVIPAEEDRYALFRQGANLFRRDITTVVPSGSRLEFRSSRNRAIGKAIRAGVTWGPSDEFEQFWPILEDNLSLVHRVRPVHTVGEIQRLRELFRGNIRLYCSFLDGEIVAGTVIYGTEKVAHAQYIASSEKGRTSRALDLLFSRLITEEYNNTRFFDFGISTEAAGQRLNPGLISYKESFGGRAITYDFYEVDT